MFSYLMLSLGRPVLNPAPLPGFNTDQSYKHRRADAGGLHSLTPQRVFGAGRKPASEEVDQATKLRESGLMLCGHPEFVAE